MSNKDRSTYGTFQSEPDEKAGVEVGGGEKAAAANDERARKETQPGKTADDDHEPPAPEDPQEAQSPT